MEWRVYNRTGRVHAAQFRERAVVHTADGPLEAEPGDYLVVDAECRRLRRVPEGAFEGMFSATGRTASLRDLAALSELVSENVVSPAEGTFGMKCVRCGRERTSTEFEGFPTCQDCEMTIRAEREQRRECQMDGAEMKKEVVLNVILDRCPTCGGVWLDGGELGLLNDAIAAGADEALSVELARGLVRGVSR
ncbi:MAG: zf-TFIIB domain-containing protein [Gemmatimonadota bacterium]